LDAVASSHVSFTFPKREKLCRQKSMDALLARGSVLFAHPLRVLWMWGPPSDVPAQMMLSVPKRLFRRAVVRNRLKRRIREAYRLNRSLLRDEPGGTLWLLWVYVGKEEAGYADVERAVQKILRHPFVLVPSSVHPEQT
jgi:ribonuclease P protein component